MKLTTVLFFLAVGSHMVVVQDSQWRGENRDGLFPNTGLLQSWQFN